MSGPQDCMKDLYDQLIGFNRSWPQGKQVNPEWLVYEAKRLQRQYSSPTLPPGPDPDPNDGNPRPAPPSYNHCIDPGRTCMSR
jgi:hypothetical protein